MSCCSLEWKGTRSAPYWLIVSLVDQLWLLSMKYGCETIRSCQHTEWVSLCLSGCTLEGQGTSTRLSIWGKLFDNFIQRWCRSQAWFCFGLRLYNCYLECDLSNSISKYSTCCVIAFTPGLKVPLAFCKNVGSQFFSREVEKLVFLNSCCLEKLTIGHKLDFEWRWRLYFATNYAYIPCRPQDGRTAPCPPVASDCVSVSSQEIVPGGTPVPRAGHLWCSVIREDLST